MRSVLLFILYLSVSTTLFAQTQKKLQKSWVKTSMQDLSGRTSGPDTSYIRYAFDKSVLNISFYPAWDTYKQNWSAKENSLTIGEDTYLIEELTDTSLTFALEGFRRFRFVAQDYLSSQKEHLQQISEHNGKPLYLANGVISPRYTGKEIFRDFIQKNTSGYNIKQAYHFLATFVITEEGRMEDVKVIQGITGGFDQGVIKQLEKTARHWRPAFFAGKPVQTLMTYEIKYLSSSSPFDSGSLNGR